MDKNYFYYNLQKIAETYPDLSLGQILNEATNFAVLYNFPDDYLLQVVANYFQIKLKEPEKLEIIKEEVVEEIKEETPAAKSNHKVPDNKGRIYVHNAEGKIKAIFEDSLDEYLNNGWKYGRKEK